MDAMDFEIMVKPVSGRCNLACEYCYYRNKPRDLYPDHPAPKMDEKILAEFVRQYLTLKPQRANFCWQGGEPLLAGKDFFRTVVGFQKQFGQRGQVVGNALQTNGTLVDEEWCDFFNEYRFFLGISLDGPATLHNCYRRDPAGKGSFDAVRRGLDLLVRHRIEFNVLVTLHAGNIHHGVDLYRFFVNRGIRHLQFIPILERTAEGVAADFSCPPEAYGRFLLDVFDRWLQTGAGVIHERFFDGVIGSLTTGHAGMCWHQPLCPRAFVLEWNGDLFACDHFVTSSWRLGNLADHPLETLVHSPVFDRFGEAKASPPARCRACEFLTVCRGGCPKHHTGTDRTDPDRTNYFCEGYRLFFRHALPELRRRIRSAC